MQIRFYINNESNLHGSLARPRFSQLKKNTSKGLMTFNRFADG